MTAEVSEWLKIMLEEIARKKAEENEMLAEEQRRSGAADKCGEDAGA